jgi:hypothetical protein
MGTECLVMHIHRTNQIPVATKAAGAAHPISALGFVFVPAARTPATCSSFRASEARDVSLFGFVGEIVDVCAIFPQGHALVVVPAMVSIADTMRVANEEGSNPVFDTKVDHLAGRFMTLSADTSGIVLADFVLGSLQLLPAPGILLAAGLLLSNLSNLLTALTFETADTTSGDNEGFGSRGTDSGKMNFAQVYSCLHIPRGLPCLWDFHAHMQFKAVVPDQRTGSTVLR